MDSLRQILPTGLSSMMDNIMTNVTLTSVILFFLVALVIHRFLTRPKYPPGPAALPIIGHYKLLVDPKIHEACAKLSDKYGPVVTVQFGPSKVVILNTIETVLEALVKRRADFAGRPPVPSGMALSEGGKDILMAQYTPTWKLHRKIAGSAIQNYLKGPRLQTVLEKAMGQFLKLVEGTNGKPFTPHEFIGLSIYNIMCGFCFQKVYQFDDPTFKYYLGVDDQFVAELGMGLIEDLYPILEKVWPSQRYKNVAKLFGELVEFLNEQLEAHKRDFDEGNIRDFADCLILARREAEKEDDPKLLNQLTDVHLRQTLSDIFIAGVQTSRFTIQWALLYIADNQDVQRKVQEELDRVVGRNRLPEVDDRPSLPYTEATLYEVMRIASVAPLGMPHIAVVDSSVGGYIIPKDTTVILNHWALHNDPRHWKEPSKFDPKRFLNPDGTFARKPESWLPFSAGRRVCLGESTAKLELIIILAIILHQFSIKLPPGVVADFSAEHSGIAGYTANRYKIVAEKRF
ncbi:steroid 17-alpha-hydroxylase/17,20 lyase-like [Ylistrum balloti]|uniref:steroid 17-alpha-hydroxylase/17,20 lyase-like n=1 Tax=Ylistrum balloti TaxID=509963 RepID=UPI002905C366|nr:steroid 17-alpha-hydroxylase/17,20 lyase-like [Ylistrum balloti]